jgi:uncharacterized membrane protein
MKARITLLGHPVHQALVAIPIGLYVIAVLFDIITAFKPIPALAIASYWNLVAGVIGALLAAVFGLVDWTKIPKRTRARRLGIYHALINVTATVAFAGAVAMRWNTDSYFVTTGALLLELAGFVIVGVGGWMGGELVDRLGIGVHEHAHADAPSSLSSRSITGSATPPRDSWIPASGDRGGLLR